MLDEIRVRARDGEETHEMGVTQNLLLLVVPSLFVSC